MMHIQELTKTEQVKELEEAVNLINRVRVDLNQYYPKMSDSIVYQTNCNLDQDKLAKAINKLQTISLNINDAR